MFLQRGFRPVPDFNRAANFQNECRLSPFAEKLRFLGAAARHRYDPRCFGCGFNLALGHVGSLSISWPYLIAAGLEAVISNQTKND